jgi:predicted N-acetyltransferase YhbS
MTPDGLDFRRADPADWPAVLDLLHLAMGWAPGGDHARFLEWKHRENVFGPSPGWVAVADGEVVGFRTFLRWEFERQGQVVRAVRAVDTATHPDHRGRGIFSELTRRSLAELAADGVAFVFNTPNDQSRPGYLKLGWTQVGRPPVLFRPRSAASMVTMARAGVAADKWSLPTAYGAPAAEVLHDVEAVGRLLASLEGAPGLRTRRTPAFLSWRYGFGPLAYRVVAAGPTPESGLVVFRLRRRGPAVEAAVCEVLVPAGAPRSARALLKEVARTSGADYVVRLGGPGEVRAGFLPLPGRGPTLLWRGVGDHTRPPLAEWRLSLGDVELM